MIQMIEQSNKPLTTAIEKLTETLNDKLDTAMDIKTKKDNIKEKDNLLETITDDHNDEYMEGKCMEKLKEHQSTLTIVSQNLSSQLDQVYQTSPSIHMDVSTSQTDKDKHDNLIRNLSDTITYIDHKIKYIEDRHNNQIKNLQEELHQLSTNFNIYKKTCFLPRQEQHRDPPREYCKQRKRTVLN